MEPASAGSISRWISATKAKAFGNCHFGKGFSSCGRNFLTDWLTARGFRQPITPFGRINLEKSPFWKAFVLLAESASSQSINQWIYAAKAKTFDSCPSGKVLVFVAEIPWLSDWLLADSAKKLTPCGMINLENKRPSEGRLFLAESTRSRLISQRIDAAKAKTFDNCPLKRFYFFGRNPMAD